MRWDEIVRRWMKHKKIGEPSNFILIIIQRSKTIQPDFSGEKICFPVKQERESIYAVGLFSSKMLLKCFECNEIEVKIR